MNEGLFRHKYLSDVRVLEIDLHRSFFIGTVQYNTLSNKA